MDDPGVKRLSAAVIAQAVKDLMGSGWLRQDALHALRTGGLDMFADLVGIDVDMLRSRLERAHEVHMKRLYQQVEAELRLYPERRRQIDEIIRRYAEEIPIPYSDERIHTAGTIIADPTYHKITKLHRDKQYSRLVRIVRAVERLYRMLDSQQRRFVECYYWDGLSMEDTAREMGVSESTAIRRRREVLEMALAEFEAVGIATFDRGEEIEIVVGEKGA